MSSDITSEQKARKNWLTALALADTSRLNEIAESMESGMEFRFLRKPEVGLAMVRGRAGGAGAAFNLGEVTVTRCVVSLEDTISGAPIDGVSCIRGRDSQRAELVAKLDALFQDTGIGPAFREAALATLAADRDAVLAKHGSNAAATKVDFFTMERGH
ncbi:MAG: phosphonate C-P lyase system protein PhnG [Alphaproteobacteria bacterium]